jgi:hypothetical protein
MPSTHTGNATAANSPADPAVDRTAPIVLEPSDGDALDAASVQQLAEMPTNFLEFERAPFGHPTNHDLVQKPFRNSRLQTRGVVDHIGYTDLGQVLQVNEDWNDVGKVLKNAVANGAWGGRWNYSISGPFAGRVELSDPAPFGFVTGIYYPRTSCLLLSTGTGGITPNAESVETGFGFLADDDADLVMQWGFMHQGTTSMNSAQGFTFVSQQGVVGEYVAQNVQGAALVCRAGHANFELYTNADGVTAHLDDTGIPKDDVKHRVRLELRGANTNDNSAAHVRLYMDAAPGAAPVVDRAILIGAIAGGSAQPIKPFFKVHNTNTVTKLAVARLQIRNNTETGDAVY